MKLQVEYVPISTIKPYRRNAKLHPQEQIEQIKNSMKEFGNIDPIGVWHNEIVEGHGRYEALKQMGAKEIPIIRLDDLTDEQRKAYALVHNKLTMNSDFDVALLDTELAEIETIDMTLLGFDDTQEETPQEVVEDDFDEEPPAEPIAKYGDIYQLGRHRLMCGDSTKIDDVEKLMGGNKADMVFTDPPYGVSYEGGQNEKKKEQIKNDALRGNALFEMLSNAFHNIKNFTKEKAGIYIFYAHSSSREFLNALYNANIKQRSILIWKKLGGGFGDYMSQYMNAYEPCIYASNGNSVNWYGATNEKTVWEIEKEKKCNLHPTMKPIAVVSRAIKNSSCADNIVLDLFGGSGSTLIACEQLNRQCFMMELDPKYIDVIINRWETFTGQKAVKLNAD